LPFGDSRGFRSVVEPSPKPAFPRILLKLSGEVLCHPGGFGIDGEAVNRAAQLVLVAKEMGCQVAVVIGGGNFIRGAQLSPLGINRATADYMGMLATAINAMALQDALEKLGSQTRACSGLDIPKVMEPFIRRRAERHLEKGRIVILACGSGAPFFTTDTAAALRAVELGCHALLKATKVDGVYDKDPKKHSDAQQLKRLSYMDVMNRGLTVMDKTAITMCMENRLPIIVFGMDDPDNLRGVLRGEPRGTLIGP
jgi:uridylate kinase